MKIPKRPNLKPIASPRGQNNIRKKRNSGTKKKYTFYIRFQKERPTSYHKI
jgi:hypothetical protein